jgi:Zn-finger nucleic acid-binding protein
MDLTCPKCHGTMRTYERNGVHVDQCTECRGIFLDRGELDRLIDAENQWHGGAGPDEKRPGPKRHDDDRDEYRRDQQQSGGLGAVVGEVLSQVRSSQHGSQHGQYGYGHKPRKKESFLSDLFG